MTRAVPASIAEPHRQARGWAFAFCVFALGLRPLPAQQPVPASGWHVVHGPSFTLLSQLSAKNTLDYANQVDLLVKSLSHHLEFDRRLLPPATFILFDGRDGLMAFSPKAVSGVDFADVKSDVSGYDYKLPWGVVGTSADEGSDEVTRQGLMESAVRWLLGARPGRPLPMALGIGITEAFGTFYTDNGHGYIGRPPRNYTTDLAWEIERFRPSDDTFVPVEKLLGQTSLKGVIARQGFNKFYVESWGFVHFLIFSKEMSGTDALSRLANAFDRGLSPEPALASALGPAAADINSRFRTYAHGGDFYELEVPSEPSGLAVGDASVPEAACCLARLALITDHPDAALSYASTAVLASPDARSYDTLALVQSEARDDDDALNSCEKAIGLGSRDGWTWDLLARSRIRLSGGSPDSPESARELLNLDEKAVSYRHDIHIDFDYIANLVGYAVRVTPDDGRFLQYGRGLFPEDGWLEVGLAVWANRTGEPAAARKLLADALAHPENLSQDQAKEARNLAEDWSRPQR